MYIELFKLVKSLKMTDEIENLYKIFDICFYECVEMSADEKNNIIIKNDISYNIVKNKDKLQIMIIDEIINKNENFSKIIHFFNNYSVNKQENDIQQTHKYHIANDIVDIDDKQYNHLNKNNKIPSFIMICYLVCLACYIFGMICVGDIF